MMEDFNEGVAFSRSLGWLTEGDQIKLRKLHVGLAGLGGVGGYYAEILTRLGVGEFTVYDGDAFSIENTNRQNECKTSTYNQNKAVVISNLIKDINPCAKVHTFDKYIAENDVSSFCGKIDIYLDTLDFFALDIRSEIFKKMRSLNKPAFTVAPIGTGAAMVAFTKNSMSFDDYFGLNRDLDPLEKALRFLVGLAPSLQQQKYIQDSTRANMKAQKLPSLPMGTYSSAAVMATLVLKFIQGREESIQSAPWSIHYDPYLMKIKKSYVFWGHKNPFQKLKLYILKRILKH